MADSPLERLQRELYAGPEFVESPAKRALEVNIDENSYKSVLKELGDKYNVIPDSMSNSLIGKDDLPEPTYLGNSKSLVGKYISRAIDKFTDYFRYKEGAIPFHWGKLKIAVEDLPGWYVKTKNGVKKLMGVNGTYNPETSRLVIDKSLATGNCIGMNEEQLQKTVDHETFHSNQDYSGTIRKLTSERDDARDIIEANADIESGTNSYITEQKKYRRDYGNSNITSFRDNMRRYKQEASGYIGSLLRPQVLAQAA
ncbi:MAG: hypothetical protein JW789_03640 [Candidatus Aenigmarchaeota archaeon]|nr:hypothetical protein [Candidatus Aenigmarchaeota archaeon]